MQGEDGQFFAATIQLSILTFETKALAMGLFI